MASIVSAEMSVNDLTRVFYIKTEAQLVKYREDRRRSRLSIRGRTRPRDGQMTRQKDNDDDHMCVL